MAREWVLLLVGLCGCSSTSGGSARDLAAPPPFCTDGVDGGPPPTLAAVETLFAANCAVSGCHDSGPLSTGACGDAGSIPDVMLDLRPGHARANLVNVPSHEPCGGTRVVPGDAQHSWLYRKLVDDPPCQTRAHLDCDGLRMPRCELGSCPIPNCAIDVVRRWIEAGAPM